MMNDQYANGAAPDQQATPAAQPQGMTVCITEKPDGSYAVYQDGDEGSEPAGASEDEGAEQAQGQSAPDVDSALKLAKQLLAGGQDSAPDDAEALFQGGFNGARGQLNKG